MKTALTALLLCSIAAAQDTIPTLDTTTMRRLARPGAFHAEFSNGAKFRVPINHWFVTKDKLDDYLEKMRLPKIGDEEGALVSDESSPYTLVYVPKDDPLAGQTDLANLNKDDLLKWSEKFTNDHTIRNAGPGRTYRLGNWTHTPKYDPEKKILEMGLRMVNENGKTSQDLINHKLFVYGPEKQILCFQTIAPMADGKWSKPVDKAKKLVGEETEFPRVYEETGNNEQLYYLKLGAGGLLGMIAVIILAKLLMGKKKSAPASRRPGLPR